MSLRASAFLAVVLGIAAPCAAHSPGTFVIGGIQPEGPREDGPAHE
jgi:hypothetical protein